MFVAWYKVPGKKTKSTSSGEVVCLVNPGYPGRIIAILI